MGLPPAEPEDGEDPEDNIQLTIQLTCFLQGLAYMRKRTPEVAASLMAKALIWLKDHDLQDELTKSAIAAIAVQRAMQLSRAEIVMIEAIRVDGAKMEEAHLLAQGLVWDESWMGLVQDVGYHASSLGALLTGLKVSRVVRSVGHQCLPAVRSYSPAAASALGTVCKAVECTTAISGAAIAVWRTISWFNSAPRKARGLPSA